MISLIKDFSSLFTIELPASFSRKRLIANFVVLYGLSLKDKLLGTSSLASAGRTDVKIESHVWKSFNHIIAMYIKYLSPKYLLSTYVIRGAASGWHSKEYVQFLKDNFTEKHTSIISPKASEKVNQVAKIISSEFQLDYDALNRWLMTYQFGLPHFNEDKQYLADQLENTLIVELGAGVGANAAVHASMSKQGVFIFDIPPMLEVQRVVHAKVREHMQLSNIAYYDDPQKLMADTAGKKYIVVSYWAFTEFPENLRVTLDPLLEGAEFCLFACNSKFEGVDNLVYFNEAVSRLKGKSAISKPIDWNPYKKHSYVMVK